MPAFDPTNPKISGAALHPRHLRLHGSIFARVRDKSASIIGAANCSARGQLDTFDWPEEPTLESLGEAIAASRGLGVVIKPIPEELRHHELSGLTTVVGRTAYVFYDARLSPLNREQTILHEYAHILHRDVRSDADCTHLRSVFDDPVEKRAETTGMRLLSALHRRQRASERRRASEALDFFSGLNETRQAL